MKQAKLGIRPETPADVAAIHELNRLAFGQDAEANLVDALRSAGRLLLSLVAEKDGVIAGNICFSPATIEHKGRVTPAVGLAPMAVTPGHQRQGIGSQLIRAALRHPAIAPAIVIVLGHTEYYPRFGFVPASRHDISSEYDAGNAFMVRFPDGIKPETVKGLARYCEEFKGV